MIGGYRVDLGFFILGFLGLLSALSLRYKELGFLIGFVWIFVSLFYLNQIHIGWMLIGLAIGLYFLIKGMIEVFPNVDLEI